MSGKAEELTRDARQALPAPDPADPADLRHLKAEESTRDARQDLPPPVASTRVEGLYLKEWEHCVDECWQRVTDRALAAIFEDLCAKHAVGIPGDQDTCALDKETKKMEVISPLELMKRITEEAATQLQERGWRFCITFPWEDPMEALKFRYCQWCMRSRAVPDSDSTWHDLE